MKKRHIKDKRYTIQLEFCGKPVAWFILRFCSQYIDRYETYPGAYDAMLAYDKRRIGES